MCRCRAAFAIPEDARRAVARSSRDYIEQHSDVAPVGLWPSEGSVSDEVFAIAAEPGFEWAATRQRRAGADPEQAAVAVDGLIGPYLWRQQGDGRISGALPRSLSQRPDWVRLLEMGAADAAEHFLDRIRDNCRRILTDGRDALVPIILDGENAWEYYEHNGRPFLRELYRRISDDRDITP